MPLQAWRSLPTGLIFVMMGVALHPHPNTAESNAVFQAQHVIQLCRGLVMTHSFESCVLEKGFS